MANKTDITRLKTSWTKYDVVSMINIIGNDTIGDYLNEQENINQPVLRAYLGMTDDQKDLPEYWTKVIRDFPKERKLFAVLAGIFTHYENVKRFALEYGTTNMGGLFKMDEGGKHQTNLRSVLVESGAALTSFRRKQEVPYSFAKIYEQEDIGSYFSELLYQRLIKIGYSDTELKESFLEICYNNEFHKAISLNKTQFKSWLSGKAIYLIKEFKYDLKAFKTKYLSNPSIIVNQWLVDWNDVDFNLPLRSKPQDHFFMFKMDIRILKRISDVHRRKTNKAATGDVNVQRALKEDRSKEIKQFVNQGFPLSTLSDKDRAAAENQVLKMPGFLSSAILVNIIGPGQKRGKSILSEENMIRINMIDNRCSIDVPEVVFDESWNPDLKPIEVIDGQHRLWAFDETEEINGSFEVPVIAYYDLDRAWQAYLFYVINIKPKKINTSLGYDLYPLLRTQEWLENSRDGLKVYRETRAQEIVEALWLYPESPWFKRISMLGEESGSISQNAFIRSFSASYFKRTRKGLGGIFSDALGTQHEELKWVRAQQAAFIILIWDEIAKALNKETLKKGEFAWVDEIREDSFVASSNERELGLDKAFISRNSNLSRDQGVSGISMLSNDFFYVLANAGILDINDIDWDSDIDERQIESSSIDKAINLFVNHQVYDFIQIFAGEIIKLDWRTSAKYRGSGGYRDIWNDLVEILLLAKNNDVKTIAGILKQSQQ
jgi:DGQHR domain-containing protein